MSYLDVAIIFQNSFQTKIIVIICNEDVNVVTTYSCDTLKNIITTVTGYIITGQEIFFFSVHSQTTQCPLTLDFIKNKKTVDNVFVMGFLF